VAHRPERDSQSSQAFRIRAVTLVLMKRGNNWNPNAAAFIDVMKGHLAFVKQTRDQGNMAIAGLFPFSTEIHPWGTVTGVLASGQPMQ
jgi:hypothetical protein